MKRLSLQAMRNGVARGFPQRTLRKPLPTPFLIHEDHVVQLVNRFKADDEGWIPVLFQHRRGKQRGFEAMGGVMADDTAKAPQRRTAGRRFRVVGKRVEIRLNDKRRAQPRD